jgi:hypothetical protein
MTRKISTSCGKVYQSLREGWCFSLDTPVFSTNKTDRHDITEILLKVASNTINQTKPLKRGLRIEFSIQYQINLDKLYIVLKYIGQFQQYFSYITAQ